MERIWKMSERKHCAIFDLDGTLADTIKDIANSVNLTRKEYGLEELPLESFRGEVLAQL